MRVVSCDPGRLHKSQVGRSDPEAMPSHLRTLTPAVALLLAASFHSDVLAQVNAGGLGTRVNGSALGQCSSGSCKVSGGTKAGNTLLHRFSQFDTRAQIKSIQLDTRGLANVVVGVSHPAGTFLDKTVGLSTAANLFWFSPGGIWLGPGAGVINVKDLLLSTSSSIRLGDKVLNLFSQSSEDLARLRQLSRVGSNPLETTGDRGLTSLELNGDNSIVLAGGLIRVDRNLVLETLRGSILARPGSSSELTAGKSVRLNAATITLSNAKISAEQGKKGGLVILQNSTNPQTGKRGPITLERTALNGNRVLVDAGEIAIERSSIQAPRGYIQLSATNPDGRSSALRIARSDLDVKANSQADWSSTLSDKEPARIGLFSQGSINLDHSTLDSSQFVPQRLAIDQPIEEYRSFLQDRSGSIYLQAKDGIRLSSSRILADARDLLAGEITLDAKGDAPTGGIRINNSTLSASRGAGFGNIVLLSSGGIDVFNSSINAISENYPLLDGQSGLRLEDGSPTPLAFQFAFKGGQIYLDNYSQTSPVRIRDSQILATTSTRGGGLNNPEFSLGEDAGIGSFYSGKGGFLSGNPDSQGSPLQIFTIGYMLAGDIGIVSNAGIQLSRSQIDVSSRIDANKGMEFLDSGAGRVEISNLGEAPFTVNDTRVTAIASGEGAAPPSPGFPPGTLRLIGKSAIRIQRSTLASTDQRIAEADASVTSRNLAEENIQDINQACDQLCILSDRSIQLSNSNLKSATLALQYANENDSVLFDRTNLNSPWPSTAIDLQPKFDDLTANLGQRGAGFSLFILRSTDAQFGVGDGGDRGAQSASLAALPGQILQPQALGSGVSPSATIPAAVAVNLQQSNASALFLEGQRQSLQETTRRLGLPEGMGRIRSIADLQARLQEAGSRGSTTVVPDISLRPYVPAILHLALRDQAAAISRIDAILLPPEGEPISRSVDVPTSELRALIASFQRQLSRREPLDPSRPGAPGARLSRLLLEPLLPELRRRNVSALLLEVDRGLQAVPFGALPIDQGLLGEAFALTITPSLGLIDLDPSRRIPAGDPARLLLAGASTFSDRSISPLPMVRQELETLAREHPSTLIVDAGFSPQSLKQRASDLGVAQLHIATHAEFLPGQGSSGRLFTPNDALSLADLGRSLRARPGSRPLDLISLSGCVTALGDEQSELGFVGMALQAGARSGLGSLWEVDDAATAAFFIQYFRYLKLGLAKDQALQATQAAFRNGAILLQGDRLVGPGRQPLISGLSREEQALFSQGLRHPYYWAGMILTGSPW